MPSSIPKSANTACDKKTDKCIYHNGTVRQVASDWARLIKLEAHLSGFENPLNQEMHVRTSCTPSDPLLFKISVHVCDRVDIPVSVVLTARLLPCVLRSCAGACRPSSQTHRRTKEASHPASSLWRTCTLSTRTSSTQAPTHSRQSAKTQATTRTLASPPPPTRTRATYFYFLFFFSAGCRTHAAVLAHPSERVVCASGSSCVPRHARCACGV